MTLASLSPTKPLPDWIKPSDALSQQEPAWLQEKRSLAWQQFVKVGLPNAKNERWKYCDVSVLANFKANQSSKLSHPEQAIFKAHYLPEMLNCVFVDGELVPGLSDLSALPDDVIICDIKTASQQHGDLLQQLWPQQLDAKKYPFAMLALAQFQQGLLIVLPDHCEKLLPLHCIHFNTGKGPGILQSADFIMLGKASHLQLTTSYIGLDNQAAYLNNQASFYQLQADAKLEVTKIQRESTSALHLGHLFLTQAQQSESLLTSIAVGSQFARDEISVDLLSPGANCRTGGFYQLKNDGQYIDHHIDINHAAASSLSEMLFKGTLAGKSRAVFNGKLLVQPNAQKILAYQANHNLLLSKTAEVYTKPELEIYADDVKCKHGATIGQLDEETLFYLRARGIPYQEALNMMLQGFAEEVLKRISLIAVRRQVEEIIL